MPRIERSAKVEWEGNVARGAGTLSGATGAFSRLPFTLPSRIGDPDGKTSPEELLAAATAGCFTMSLGSELVRDGTPAGRLEVHCRIIMDEVAGEGHQIVGAELAVSAVVRVRRKLRWPLQSCEQTRGAHSRRCSRRRVRPCRSLAPDRSGAVAAPSGPTTAARGERLTRPRDHLAGPDARGVRHG